MRQLQIVRYSKGQMKIQEMAFVLVAIFIFFALVALLYFSIRLSGLRQSAQMSNDDQAREMVKKIASMPEFSSPECDSCIDLDKALIVKNKVVYNNFWELDYLKIERVYPKYADVECTTGNYPNCNSISVKDSEDFGTPSWAFVSLCRYENTNGGYIKCELGRVYASGMKIG